jgi:hypothetical protein
MIPPAQGASDPPFPIGPGNAGESHAPLDPELPDPAGKIPIAITIAIEKPIRIDQTLIFIFSIKV